MFARLNRMIPTQRRVATWLVQEQLNAEFRAVMGREPVVGALGQTEWLGWDD